MSSCPTRTKLNYNPPKQDGSAYRIELQGVSMSIMKQILDYIFSGEVSVCVPPAFFLTHQSSVWVLPSQISLDEETIQDMVQASDLLLMTDLKALCCQFLESCITAENCVGIRLFSLRYCLHHVHYVATEFLQTHFGDVARSEEFRELPADQLCELLSMEKLNIGNEEHVLEAVVRWFAHDPEERRVGVGGVRDGWGLGLTSAPSPQAHMKEVTSAVWMDGLELSYLREQVSPHLTSTCHLHQPHWPFPIRPWGSR